MCKYHLVTWITYVCCSLFPCWMLSSFQKVPVLQWHSVMTHAAAAAAAGEQPAQRYFSRGCRWEDTLHSLPTLMFYLRSNWKGSYPVVPLTSWPRLPLSGDSGILDERLVLDLICSNAWSVKTEEASGEIICFIQLVKEVKSRVQTTSFTAGNYLMGSH